MSNSAKTKQINRTYKAVLNTAPPIPMHLTNENKQDISILDKLYNQAIDLYFHYLTLAEDAGRQNNTGDLIKHSTSAAMASYEAKRLDTLRIAILHQANYFKK